MANIDIPASVFRECTFSLDEGTVSSGSGRGQSFNLTQVADPVWRAHCETKALTRQERQVWEAWKKSLRGGMNRLRIYDAARAEPLAYLDAASPDQVSAGWSGGGVAAVVGLSGALRLTGVPAGYRASPDDRVGLSQGGRVGYYSILVEAVASAAGQIDLTVAPLLHRTYFGVGAVATLWRPRALFIMDWKSWSLPETIDMPSASFDAYQVLQ